MFVSSNGRRELPNPSSLVFSTSPRLTAPKTAAWIGGTSWAAARQAAAKRRATARKKRAGSEAGARRMTPSGSASLHGGDRGQRGGPRRGLHKDRTRMATVPDRAVAEGSFP